MIKFGICGEIFQGATVEDALTAAARIGYDGVEIAPYTIARLGYQGYATVEVFKFEEGSETIATRSLEFLRRAFGGPVK